MHPTNSKITLRAISFAAVAALCGCTTYVDQRPRADAPPPPVVYAPEPPPREVYTPQPPPPQRPRYNIEVEVRSEQDFYEPLRPYGHWENVESHGRCWIPDRVEPDWRPYTNGHWQRTEAGWYWVSEEPWAWATYHYGRWDFHPSFGWYWVPEVQWAPAWVSWHQGGGYVGWAPLPPTIHFSESRIDERARPVTPRAYVFVEERRFLEPVRPTTVVNNTTIINKTVNITNIKVVNQTVINEGPRTQFIEQASGKKVQAVQAREERRRTEANVASRQQALPDRNAKVRLPPNTPAPSDQLPSGSRINNSSEADSRMRLEEQRRAIEAAKAQTESTRRTAEDQRRAQEEALRLKRLQERQAQDQAAMKDRQEKTKLEAERKAQSLEAKAKVEAEARAKEANRQAQIDFDRRAHTQAPPSLAEEKRIAREKQIQLESQRRETNRLATPVPDNRPRKQQAADEKLRREAARAQRKNPGTNAFNEEILTNTPANPPK